MIVSHKHKFIFVKSLKTGGTSVEAFLASYCGPDDIITPVDSRDEMIRRKLGVFPRNFLRRKYGIPDEATMDFASAKELVAFRKEHRYAMAFPTFEADRTYCAHHSRASNIRAVVGTVAWDEYHKFCFERDPWDRTLSSFYFQPANQSVEMATDAQIREFIEQKDKTKTFCNSKFYMDNHGRLIVDKVYDFARMDDAVREICDRFGFDFAKFKETPRFKGKLRKDRRPYDEFLTQPTIERITEVHQRAVDFMGYKPRPSKVGAGTV